MKKLDYILVQLPPDFLDRDNFVRSYTRLGDYLRLLVYAAVRMAGGHSFKSFSELVFYAKNINLITGMWASLEKALCWRRDVTAPLLDGMTYICDLDSGIGYYAFYYDEEAQQDNNEVKNDVDN